MVRTNDQVQELRDLSLEAKALGGHFVLLNRKSSIKWHADGTYGFVKGREGMRVVRVVRENVEKTKRTSGGFYGRSFFCKVLLRRVLYARWNLLAILPYPAHPSATRASA